LQFGGGKFAKVRGRKGEVIPANAGEDAGKLVDKLGHFPSSVAIRKRHPDHYRRKCYLTLQRSFQLLKCILPSFVPSFGEIRKRLALSIIRSPLRHTLRIENPPTRRPIFVGGRPIKLLAGGVEKRPPPSKVTREGKISPPRTNYF
jgi:hypothetical protein